MEKSHYDIRWQQRLEHFTLLLSQLEEVSGQKVESMRIVEIAGWIHIFDLTFELAWKTMRDYMVFRGESERLDFTRDILQVALMRGLIEDEAVWIEMLTDRNSSTHEYDENLAKQVVRNIQDAYLSILRKTHKLLSSYA